MFLIGEPQHIVPMSENNALSIQRNNLGSAEYAAEMDRLEELNTQSMLRE